MQYFLEISRCAAGSDDEYFQTFEYVNADEGATVATALRELNAQETLCDVNGKQSGPIRWECSCLQKKCGACAMVINGLPRMACDARLNELVAVPKKVKGTAEADAVAAEKRTIRLEPLRKFPRVADLIVDRQPVFDRLKQADAWLAQEVELPVKRNAVAYEASRCLECGCCLEVCPNFSVDGTFGGMAFMTPFSRLLAEAPKGQRSDLAAKYRETVFSGCGKSLACRNICPAEIDIASLMSRSTAAAVFKRF